MRGTIDLLENPFKTGDVITIPAGTEYISMAPNVDGLQVTKKKMTITVHKATEGYTFDYDAFNASVSAAGAGGYWKYFYLSEEMLKANGHPIVRKTFPIILPG